MAEAPEHRSAYPFVECGGQLQSTQEINRCVPVWPVWNGLGTTRARDSEKREPKPENRDDTVWANPHPRHYIRSGAVVASRCLELLERWRLPLVPRSGGARRGRRGGYSARAPTCCPQSGRMHEGVQELYDISSDPLERRELSGKRPVEAEAMRARVRAFVRLVQSWDART